MKASSGCKENKDGSVSTGTARWGRFVQLLLLCKAKKRSALAGIKSRSECIGEEVNSCYLDASWMNRNADGRAFYIDGASLSHQYFVTTNPAATSDSFLSFTAASKPAVLVLERPSAHKCLSEVPSVLDPHLLLSAHVFVCLCAYE